MGFRVHNLLTRGLSCEKDLNTLSKFNGPYFLPQLSKSPLIGC